jgi:ribonuclease inhibitor
MERNEMIEVRLDGRQISDKKQLHDQLSMELGFPAWYGSNLDALYDCLTDIHEDTLLVVSHWEQLMEQLGDYGTRCSHVLSRAEEENHWFHLCRK